MKTPLFVRKQSGGMFTVVNETDTTGNLFWVDSGSATKANSVGSGQNPDKPFSTIDYAVGRCTANNGDRIIVMPGHTETITTDGGLAIDVDGLTIVGLGEGDQRPTISITTLAAASMIISGAGTVMRNFRWSVGIDAATDPFQISAAGCHIYDIEIIEASACEALDLISLNASATRCHLHDIIIRGRNTTDGDALNAIHLDGCDDVVIHDIHAYGGDWSEGVIFNEGDEALNLTLYNLLLETAAPEDISIQVDTNATGNMYNIYCVLSDDAANIDECIVPGKMHQFDPILVVNADGEKAIEWPGTDSVDEA